MPDGRRMSDHETILPLHKTAADSNQMHEPAAAEMKINKLRVRLPSRPFPRSWRARKQKASGRIRRFISVATHRICHFLLERPPALDIRHQQSGAIRRQQSLHVEASYRRRCQCPITRRNLPTENFLLPIARSRMLRIHRDFPDALFVHIIRDARDLALSLDKRGWSRPLPWQKEKGLLAAGLYWEWIVRKGRKYGAILGPQYQEVRYEDLVQTPAESLAKLGRFLGCDLDYERIRENSIGSVKKPLTSFKEDLQQGTFSPVGRFKDKFPPDQLLQFERLVGNYLQELGYQLSSDVKSGASMPAGCFGFVWGKISEAQTEAHPYGSSSCPESPEAACDRKCLD